MSLQIPDNSGEFLLKAKVVVGIKSVIVKVMVVESKIVVIVCQRVLLLWWGLMIVRMTVASGYKYFALVNNTNSLLLNNGDDFTFLGQRFWLVQWT